MRSDALPRLARALLLPVAALAGGCYDGDPTGFRDAVVVGREHVTGLAIDGEVAILEVGATLQLAATGTTASGTVDLSGDVTWRSSNPAVLAVDAAGRVTAFANGSADITATLAQFSDTVTVAASDAALQTITVGGSAAVDECGTAAYTASGHYDDGSDRDITALVTWAVGDTAVARMSTLAADRNTLVAKTAGTVGVTASRGGVDSTAYTVTVLDNLDALAVTPDTVGQLADGDERQFTATGTWGLASGDISRAATWAVVNDDAAADNIAAVANGDARPGLLTAASGGTGTLNASCGGQADSVAITVVYLDTLAITNVSPIIVAPNATVLLVLEGTYSDGARRTLNESATWSVTPVTGVAVTVSNVAGSRGRVTAGSGDGVSTVAATVDGKTTSVTVQVEP